MDGTTRFYPGPITNQQVCKCVRVTHEQDGVGFGEEAAQDVDFDTRGGLWKAHRVLVQLLLHTAIEAFGHDDSPRYSCRALSRPPHSNCMIVDGRHIHKNDSIGTVGELR